MSLLTRLFKKHRYFSISYSFMTKEIQLTRESKSEKKPNKPDKSILGIGNVQLENSKGGFPSAAWIVQYLAESHPTLEKFTIISIQELSKRDYMDFMSK